VEGEREKEKGEKKMKSTMAFIIIEVVGCICTWKIWAEEPGIGLVGFEDRRHTALTVLQTLFVKESLPPSALQADEMDDAYLQRPVSTAAAAHDLKLGMPVMNWMGPLPVRK